MTGTEWVASVMHVGDDVTETAQATLVGMSREQLGWTPGGDAWSAGQIADHLVKANRFIVPVLEKALASAPVGSEAVVFTWLERQLLKVYRPGTKIRLPVPPTILPEVPTDPERTVQDFLASHEALLNLVRATSDKDLSQVKVPSPIIQAIKVRYRPYIQILVMHEQYHMGQIVELARSMR